MPIQLAAPVMKDFTLDRSDLAYGNEGEATKVTVFQATQAENERRALVHSEVTQIINAQSSMDAELRLYQKWSMEELKRIEVYLTMVGCNILDRNGNDLFRFKNGDDHAHLDMTEAEFRKLRKIIPLDIASALLDMLLEVTIPWAGPLAK